MTERWRKPVKILELIPNPGETVHIAGRTYAGTEFLLEDEEDFERIKQGYVCMQCMEPHEQPFPERCIVCGFAMRAEQADRLVDSYQGEKRVGARMSLEDELARMAEDNERRKHNPQSSILLPPGVSL